jgi:methyl-accepting chemotaxis protein
MITKLLPKRIWLVNRDLQFRYTGAGVVAGLASTALTAALILYPLFSFKILTLGIFLPLPIMIAMIGAAILNCIVQIFFGIILTHRIAGPMFSLVRHLRLIASGKWRLSVRHRKGDELQILARHLNEMSDSLVATATRDIERLEAIKSALIQSTGDQKALETIVMTVDQVINSVKARIQP